MAFVAVMCKPFLSVVLGVPFSMRSMYAVRSMDVDELALTFSVMGMNEGFAGIDIVTVEAVLKAAILRNIGRSL